MLPTPTKVATYPLYVQGVEIITLYSIRVEYGGVFLVITNTCQTQVLFSSTLKLEGDITFYW